MPRDGVTQGEVVIRGNTVMKGYYKSQQANREAMRDGWFYSGDAAVWHEHGYIQIKDRLKDVIICKIFLRLKLRLFIPTSPNRGGGCCG